MASIRALGKGRRAKGISRKKGNSTAGKITGEKGRVTGQEKIGLAPRQDGVKEKGVGRQRPRPTKRGGQT